MSVSFGSVVLGLLAEICRNFNSGDERRITIFTIIIIIIIIIIIVIIYHLYAG
jgi:predicted nucleic acid-binding Zn ribbon protein